jgi:hypothetical protein
VSAAASPAAASPSLENPLSVNLLQPEIFLFKKTTSRQGCANCSTWNLTGTTSESQLQRPDRLPLRLGSEVLLLPLVRPDGPRPGGVRDHVLKPRVFP